MPTKFIRKKNRLPIPQIYKSNNSFFITICIEGRVCVLCEICNETFTEVRRVTLAVPETRNVKHFPTNQTKQKNGFEYSPLGQIVEQTWLDLPNMFENIILDEFVIMPNHFHGIITFLDTPIRKSNGQIVDLSEVISTFKSVSWHKINKVFVEEPLRFQKEYELLGYQNWNVKHSPTKKSIYNDKICSGTLEEVRSGTLEVPETRNVKHSPTKKSFPSFWQKSFYDHVIRNEQDLERIREYIFNNPLKWELDLLNPINEDKYQKWIQRNRQPA